MHTLIFKLDDQKRIRDVFGPEITDQLSKDLTRSFAQMADSLLRQHRRTGPSYSPEPGAWAAPFVMRGGELPPDPEEQKSSIGEAAVEMARGMLDRQMGRAAAMNIGFRAGVVDEWDAIRALPRADEDPPLMNAEDFRLLLNDRAVDLQLQPIVSMKDMRTVGFEALARGPEGSPVRGADKLFHAASWHGLRERLDCLCIEKALEAAKRLPPPYWMSVNLSPDLLESEPVQEILLKEPLANRVLEITEHMPLASHESVTRILKTLRGRGASLALDDAGCGFLSLDHAQALSPEIVKLCITVVRRVESGPQAVRAIEAAVARIHAGGALALAEGVERREQLELVKACGFDLVQGFLFSPPRPVEAVMAELLGKN